MLKLLLVMSLVGVLGASFDPTVTLSGAAKDCMRRTQVQVPGVTIGAFNPTKNRKMLDVLRSMDTATFVDADTAAMTRFGAKYVQLIGLIGTSTALARTTSNPAGDFSVAVPAADSVLVVGYEAVEDEPYYYSYRMVGARANTSFFLDMSRGSCQY